MDARWVKGLKAAVDWMDRNDIVIDGGHAANAAIAMSKGIMDQLQKKIDRGTACDDDYEAALSALLVQMMINGLIKNEGRDNFTLSVMTREEFEDMTEVTDEDIRAAAEREVGEMED